MGKNYSDNWHSIKNTEDVTMKQMFDISEKLITEQSDEINGMSHCEDAARIHATLPHLCDPC